ncbi:hypothetical protein F8388_021978 [Cannabis sativa]|uniref:Diacylglycerol kinase accessory domain-containing protein n=1 Tax=Cannabis sativa TaxID=3483 RepID=A0A7J6FG59_CANSA|nr:hypothetical protein F8388_021978 [Cannabis sativa]
MSSLEDMNSNGCLSRFITGRSIIWNQIIEEGYKFGTMWESNGVILNVNVLAITGSMTLVLMVDQRPIFDSKIPCFLQSLVNAHCDQALGGCSNCTQKLITAMIIAKNLNNYIGHALIYKDPTNQGDSSTLLSTTLIWVVWRNEDENYDNFDLQSIHDKILEVVSITRTWHLGKLQMVSFLCSLLSGIQTQMPWICFSTGILVGLSRAPRLAQGQSIKIQLLAAFPVQIDGEPWFQQSCTLAISHHGQRAAVEPLGHAAAIITDVLENAETNSVINASQKRALLQEMALRLS